MACLRPDLCLVSLLFDSILNLPCFGRLNLTDRLDFNTYAFKTASALTLFGDNIKDVMQVRHTEDDYNTWSAYRNVDLSLQKPILYNLGSYRRRIYELLYTGNQPLRLAKIELNISGNISQQSE